MKKYLARFGVVGVCLILAAGGSVAAATIYSAGSLLQIGDVQSKHILDATIVDRDIATSSAIQIEKLHSMAGNTSLLYDDSGAVATATAATYAKASGRLTATSLNATNGQICNNGTCFTLPSTDGTSGNSLQTNGAGVLSFGSTNSAASTITVMGAGPMNTGDAVYINTTTSTSTQVTFTSGQNSFYAIGDGAGDAYIDEKFTATSYAVSDFEPCLKKVGSPTDNLVVTIFTDSAGSPSGTVIASTTIPMSSITTPDFCDTISIYFKGPAYLNSATYHIAMSRDSTLDGSNYMKVSETTTGHGGGVSAGTCTAAFSCTLSTSQGVDSLLKLGIVANQAMLTTAADTGHSNGYIGFVQSTTTAAGNVNVVISGEATINAGVAANTQYYLGNNFGVLGSSAGTVTRKAAIGVDGSHVIITNVW